MEPDVATRIERTIVGRLQEAFPDLDGRVYTGLVDPLGLRDLPAIVVEVGTETVLGYHELGGGPPDRLQERELAVVVAVVDNASARTFKASVRRRADQVRALLADVDALGLDLTSLDLATVVPDAFPSEEGRQGGYTLTYGARFASPESDPSVVSPRF